MGDPDPGNNSSLDSPKVCTGGSRTVFVDEQSLSLVKLMAHAKAPAGLPDRHPHLQS